MRSIFILVPFLICGLVFAVPSTITFEAGSVPGFNPTDGLVLSNQFEASHGVVFSANSGSPNAHIIQAGGTAAGFVSAAGNDAVVGGQPSIGSFFIGGGTNSNFAPSFDITLTFTQRVKHVSGIALDLESPERIVISIFDSSQVLLESVDLNTLSPRGDGIATPWSFDRSTNDIASMRILANRDGGGLIGTGIDNITIDRTPVPEPSSIVLALTALAFLVMRRK